MITVYTTHKATVKAIEQAASGRKIQIVHETPRYADQPHRVDFVITKARLSAGLERWAAGRGAIVIQIPESVDYLITQAEKRDVTVLGSDYQKVTNKNG